MGPRTDAARAEVLAAREGLDEELLRLEAAGRAAVDIPARLRREPVKVLGTAGGAAFLLLGGPQRLFRRARRAIFGPTADLPKSMLPKEIEKTLRKLGDDGDHVRAALEREFADYLDEKAPARRERDLGTIASVAIGNVLRPVTERLGRQLAEQIGDVDAAGFASGLRRARQRRASSETPAGPDEAKAR